MKVFLEEKEITIDELKNILDISEKVIELVEIDDDGNFHFEASNFGFYY